MRVKFIADFDWHPNPRTTIAYKKGMEMAVPQACGDAAIAAGKARMTKPAQSDRIKALPVGR
jgi:hypothetical protein